MKVKASGLKKKGEIKLIPVTDLNKVVAKFLVSTTAVSGCLSQPEFFLEQPAKAVKADSESDLKKEHVFAAFWWAKKTSNVWNPCFCESFEFATKSSLPFRT